MTLSLSSCSLFPIIILIQPLTSENNLPFTTPLTFVIEDATPEKRDRTAPDKPANGEGKGKSDGDGCERGDERGDERRDGLGGGSLYPLTLCA